MTVEQKLHAIIGQYVFALVVAETNVEQLKARVAELEAELAKAKAA